MPPKLKSTPTATRPPRSEPLARGLGAPPRPTPRLQAPDKAAPVAIPTPEELGLPIPTPEDLGIGAGPSESSLVPTDTPIDWAMVERELDRYQATGYQMEKQATGYRFTITLPNGSISGRGASKGEAVRHAMRQLTK